MATQALTFLLNKNLDFPITDEPWTSLLSAAGMSAEATTDIPKMNQLLAEGVPDMAYVPGAGFCVMMRKGISHYRGLVIATSKFSGQPAQRTLLVVRHDDQASCLDDLEGSTYGYLNRSCSSSFFPPAIMLHEKGKKLETFFTLKQVPGWQDRVDAVIAQSIRATMILEDVWKMTPENAQTTKVIGEYHTCVPAVLIVRKDLRSDVVTTFQEHLLSYRPDWKNVYGAFRPFYFADIQTFYHQLCQLPDDEVS
ncbi:PhnD/SsuA/transferrin family substrate-binding protein [Paraburkholderia sp. C35]|uniref:phosphate/phosphite/phosphonate ABC transporter substrate-binding protein n=1 Tax=Paraburkholderia sp. C35 TaxID=2126993 RepID=UPI000D68DAC7|nr:PhnD/SsuA/transferrin family substrate-binding protein [Paraburkholderia sp. C35]